MSRSLRGIVLAAAAALAGCAGLPKPAAQPPKAAYARPPEPLGYASYVAGNIGNTCYKVTHDILMRVGYLTVSTPFGALTAGASAPTGANAAAASPTPKPEDGK